MPSTQLDVSPFPDDDTLGLPPWCPRAPDIIPFEIRDLLADAVHFAPTLTAAGRRHMLAYGGAQVILGRELRVAARAPHRTRGATALGTRSHLTHLIRKTRRRLQMVVSHEELYEAIARDGDVRANSVMCEFLAQPGIATAMQALCSALVRAAFVWRLEWTQQPPRDWWWPMLEMVTAQSEDWPMEVYHLPAAFLPPHEILRLAPILLPTSEWAAARLSLCEGASPEVLAELCRLAPPQRAGPLLTVLRHRRDLSTIAPALMPALLGHANPEMARFGLELATGMTQASRPR